MPGELPQGALGALKACTLPLSTPAEGSMATLRSVGRRLASASRSATCGRWGCELGIVFLFKVGYNEVSGDMPTRRHDVS